MNKNSGFTLMELMVAIGIFAILSAIAVPNAMSWLRNSQFNSAVRNVKASMGDMRMFAIKSNSDATIRFDGDNTYETEKQNRGTGNPAVTQIHTLAPGISLTSNFSSNELTFGSRGMATNGTLTIQADNGLCLEILVSRVGTSRIQACP